MTTKKYTLVQIFVLVVVSSFHLAFAKDDPLDIKINGRALTKYDIEAIRTLERETGYKPVNGEYWYDNATGALGKWKGPMAWWLKPGLRLGGEMPPEASGGGNGYLTGVFVNGREIHPIDVRSLQAMLGTPVLPGRWWVDAYGNCGLEAQPAQFNLFQLARQNKQNNSHYKRKNNGDGSVDSTYVGKGCTTVNGHTGSGSDKSEYSYTVGCE